MSYCIMIFSFIHHGVPFPFLKQVSGIILGESDVVDLMTNQAQAQIPVSLESILGSDGHLGH